MIEEEDSFIELDEDELREIRNNYLSECICGAYIWSMKKQEFIQIADCCCGRT